MLDTKKEYLERLSKRAVGIIEDGLEGIMDASESLDDHNTDIHEKIRLMLKGRRAVELGVLEGVLIKLERYAKEMRSKLNSMEGDFDHFEIYGPFTLERS